MQVFIPGTEQGFNVRGNLNALLHSALAYPSVDGYAVFAAITLRWHCCHAGTPVPAFATTKFFSLQVEPAGMLAPEVQATTIELRVRRGSDRSQWQAYLCGNGSSTPSGERPAARACYGSTERNVGFYAPSPFTSATEAGSARARAQSLSS